MALSGCYLNAQFTNLNSDILEDTLAPAPFDTQAHFNKNHFSRFASVRLGIKKNGSNAGIILLGLQRPQDHQKLFPNGIE